MENSVVKYRVVLETTSNTYKGRVALSEEGITAFEIGGAIGLGNNTNLSGKATGTDPTKIPDWNVQVTTDYGDFKHTGDLKYSSSTQDLFAKYTGEKESPVYYASLSGNAKSDTLSQFKTGAKYTPGKETYILRTTNTTLAINLINWIWLHKKEWATLVFVDTNSLSTVNRPSYNPILN